MTFCCTLHNRHQRNFLLQHTGANIETHNWTLCRELETLRHSALNEMSTLNPPLKSHETPVDRKQKECKNQGMVDTKKARPLKSKVLMDI